MSTMRRASLCLVTGVLFRASDSIRAQGTKLMPFDEASRDPSFIDTREGEAWRAGTLPGARNIPRSGVLEGKDVGEVKRAKDDGRLPMEDHNTWLIVFGRDSAEARYVADALAREAFHNVAYFSGTFDEVRAAVGW